MSIMVIGVDLKYEMPLWRSKMVRTYINTHAKFVFWVLRMNLHFEEDKQISYAEYLGPNWRKELQERKKPVSTIVANHVSFIDLAFLIASPEVPGFTPKYQVQFVPGLGKILACL